MGLYLLPLSHNDHPTTVGGHPEVAIFQPTHNSLRTAKWGPIGIRCFRGPIITTRRANLVLHGCIRCFVGASLAPPLHLVSTKPAHRPNRPNCDNPPAAPLCAFLARFARSRDMPTCIGKRL